MGKKKQIKLQKHNWGNLRGENIEIPILDQREKELSAT
jgi:hypothetical protein